MKSIDCRVVKFVTPDKFILKGLWIGPTNPRKTVIFVHGLGSSAMSVVKRAAPIASGKISVLAFDNRGHDIVSRIKKIDKRKKPGYRSITAGKAYEDFMDCVDDIQGAVDFVSNHTGSQIYFAGHSTGCQKSIYYLSRQGKQKFIKGAILLCPVSDYAAILKFLDYKKLKEITQQAKNLVKKGKGNELLPTDLWPQHDSANRFLSLYKPESKEEIFTYANPTMTPKTLQKVKIPVLVVLAEEDEYSDRPVTKLADWFKQNNKSDNFSLKIIKNSGHSFYGFEEHLGKTIAGWLKRQ